MPPESSSIQVRDNPTASRFEASVDGQLAIADYEVRGNVIVFPHTLVPPSLQGRGIASALIKAALAAARERRLKVVPACSFVRAYMDRHPETHDLLARKEADS